jgi:hypothetical protein
MSFIEVAFVKWPFTSATVPAATVLYLFNHSAQGTTVLIVGAILQVLYLLFRYGL